MRADSSRERAGAAWVVAGLLALLSAGPARADRFVLRGGGVLHGVELEGAATGGKVAILTATSANPVVFDRGRVLKVEPEPSLLDDYLRRRDAAGTDAEAHYQLGLWCDENKLSGPAQIEYARAAEFDPNHAAAHKKLGHVQHGERWMTYDEMKAAQGLIKHKGRWISQQELDEIENKQALNQQQESWARRLKILRQAMLSNDPTQRQQAEAQLIAIRDPAAAEPLLRTFGRDPDELRTMLDATLDAIPGPEGSAALLKRVFAEPEPNIRAGALDALARRADDAVVPKLLGYLRSKNPAVVGRAAWALAGLHEVAAVSKLIPHLVWVEYQVVMVPGATVANGPGGISVGFTNANPPGIAGAGTSTAGGTYVGPTYGVLTPPAVAPGAVAYGGGSIQPGMTYGGNLSGGRPQPKLVAIPHENPEVREALIKLTGTDFGYNAAAWKQFLKVGLRRADPPARQVPQP